MVGVAAMNTLELIIWIACCIGLYGLSLALAYHFGSTRTFWAVMHEQWDHELRLAMAETTRDDEDEDGGTERLPVRDFL